VTATLWDQVADGARRESPLWAAALRPPGERELEPVFSPLGAEQRALGVETIYEGYLLHYGRPRLFDPPGPEDALLLGDYLYAHGLVRVAELHDVGAVADLAALISVCAQLRAEGTSDGDGAAWAATAALAGANGLAAARDALRLRGESAPLLALARSSAGSDAVDEALAAHRRRVS
jgi:hypothetical protein